jgi:Zn-dependent protease with chaperone function
MPVRTYQCPTALIYAAIFLPSLACHAQSVRRESQFGSSRKAFERAAEKQGRTDFFSAPYEASGTQVRITFDARDADISLMTGRAYGQPALLERARFIADELGYPRADYILMEGSKTITVDIELNKYLRIDHGSTDIVLDLWALSDSIKEANLPAPVVMGVECEDFNTTTLTTDATTRTLGGFWFAGLSEVAQSTSLHFHAYIPRFAYPIAYAFCAMFLVPPVTILWLALRKDARREEKPADPSEVQAKYDRAKPQWMFMLLLAAPSLVFLLSNPIRLLAPAFLVMPMPMRWLPLAALAPMLASLAIRAAIRRHRRKESPEAEGQAGEQDIIKRTAMLPLRIMGALMLIMMGLVMIPMYFPTVPMALGASWRWIVWTIVGLGITAVLLMPLITWYGTRSLRTVLTIGPWFDLVQALAERSGVRMRRVAVIRSKTANAYVTLLGTVGLTSGLLEKLDEDEVRAVVAHELAHLKRGHVKRTLGVTLTWTTGVYATWWMIERTFLKSVSPNVYAALNNPIVYVVLLNTVIALVVGPGKRRREEEADRLAVEWTGDPDLVIRALTKIHTLNESPHRLKRSDEAIHSHPSLVHRVEAIRRAWPECAREPAALQP